VLEDKAELLKSDLSNDPPASRGLYGCWPSKGLIATGEIKSKNKNKAITANSH